MTTLPPLLSHHAPQFGPRHCFRHQLSAPDALPFGFWILENGDEALFDRNYQMIWIRQPNCPAQRADHVREWTWVYMRYFHDISAHPRNKRMRRALENLLQDFIAGGPLRAPSYVLKVHGVLVSSSPRPSRLLGSVASDR